MKYLDTLLEENALPDGSVGFRSGNGSWCLCNGVLQGSTSKSRIGNAIVMHRLQVRGYIINNPSYVAPMGPVRLRVVVVFDRQSNGGTPVFSDVFLSQYAEGLPRTEVHSYVNVANSERFSVLHDSFYVTPSTAPDGAVGVAPFNQAELFSTASRAVVEIDLDLYALFANYRPQSISTKPYVPLSVTSGSLWVVCFTDGPPAALTHWYLRGTARVSYTD